LLNEEVWTDDPRCPMDSLTLRELLTSHVLRWGNGYAAIERDGSMRPVGLIPLMPDCTEPLLDDNDRLYYRNYPHPIKGRRRSGDGFVDIQPRNILHIKGLGWDGYCGHSVISLARNSWGLGMAQQKHGATHFSRGAQPSIVLETESRLTQEDAERLLKNWEERHSNEARPAILSNGLKVSPYSMSNEDSQWLESRAFQRVEVSVWFKMPPHKLGASSRTAYNSIESENRSYLNQTLKGWLKKWESECRRKLLTEWARRSRSVVIQHDTQDILAADIETQVDVLTRLREAEILNRNEVRRKLGWSSTEGGDDFTNPNVRPAERDANDSEPGDTTLDARAISAQKALIADRLDRMVGIESKAAIKAAHSSDNFVQWVDEYYEGFGGKVAESLDPVINAYSVLPGVSCEFTATRAAQVHVSTSKSLLLEVAGYSDASNLAANVTTAVESWPARAVTMAGNIIGEG